MQLSWVFVNFALLFLFAVGFCVFVVASVHSADTIWNYHDTISSFCAKANSWEHRYLLFLSIVTSLNLLMLHFEEFNSRHPKQSDTEIMLFCGEIPAIFCLMLVGICYTRGNDPSAMNTHFEFGVTRCNIHISELLHSAFALFFFLVVTAVNVVHTAHLMNRQRAFARDGLLDYWCWISIVWCTFNVMVGLAFFSVQAILFCSSRSRAKNNRNNIKNENDDEADAENGRHAQQQRKQHVNLQANVMSTKCHGKMPRLRMISFVLELVWVASIVFHDGCNSIYRNRLFPWFGDGPLSP